MAPLSQAIRVEYARKLRGDISVYQGQTDKDWTVMAVPNGGYVLALTIEASMQHQSKTRHPDPIHVTAHFLRSAAVGQFEVHISVLKSGRGFTNLSVQFVQQGQCRVMTHIIHGVLEPSSEDTPVTKLTVAPPSPYARRIPMHNHPSQCQTTPARAKWTYKDNITLANDPVHAKNAETPQQGLEYGLWLSLNDRQEQLTTPMLAFMADTYEALDEHIPGAHQQLRAKRQPVSGGIAITSWAPTMVMTLEFKFPVPKPSSTDYSSRTVAVFSSGKFMNDPQGRHDVYVEVWTAPSDIGEGVVKDDWKETQRCLAVSTQMALLLPMDVNKKLGSRVGPKL